MPLLAFAALFACVTVVGSAGLAVATASATPLPTAPTIKQTSGGAVVGVAKSLRISATGYPKPTLAETGALPAGMVFTAQPGSAVIDGTPGPGSGGDYVFSVTASNSQGSDTESYDLTVRQNPLFPSGFCPDPMTVGTYRQEDQRVSAYPAFFGLSENNPLPGGVQFTQPNSTTDPNLGSLSGTPEPGSGGKYGLQYTADANNTTRSLHCKLVVDEAPSFTDARMATLTTGVPLSAPVVIGGIPGYPRAVALGVAGTGPTGLVMHTMHNGKAFDVTFKGTPAPGSAGDYPIDVSASNGLAAAEDFVIVVRDPTAIVQPTTLTLSAEPSPVPFGSSGQTYTATVAGGSSPTGFVQFTTGSGSTTTVPLVGGQASFTTPAGLDAGDYTVGATYTGDATNGSSSATEDLAVTPASTSLALSGPTATPFGVAATFTASVSCVPPCGTTPSGQVDFLLNGSDTAVDLVNGQGTFTTDPTIAPSTGNEVDATFTSFTDSPGDFAASPTETAFYDVGPVSLSVTAGDGSQSDGATTVVNGGTLSVDPATVNEFSVQLAATIPGSGTPPGPLTIDIAQGTTDLTAALGLGTGSEAAPANDPGTDTADYFWTLPTNDLTSNASGSSATVTVTYGGSDAFAPSTVTFTVEW